MMLGGVQLPAFDAHCRSFEDTAEISTVVCRRVRCIDGYLTVERFHGTNF